jgi:hypothetical protein
MIAQVGDRILVEETSLGAAPRVGVITALTRPDGAPPYHVRWLDSGRRSLVFPGADARIQHVCAPAEES